MAHILAFANHKGGVGKTTTTLNTGAALAAAGYRVLLIDVDPQANLTQSAGFREPARPSLYEALTNQATLADTLLHVPPGPGVPGAGYNLVPSSLDLSGAEMELSGVAGREYLLAELLAPLLPNYDFILLDCPPSLGLLTLNALTAARYLIIPLQTEYLALQGLSKLTDVLGLIQKRLNRELELLGVVATLFDRRKVLHRDVLDGITAHFGSRVFDTRIRDNIALAEAPSAGLDIYAYQPDSHGAHDYAALVGEVLTRLGLR